jgi:transposase
MEYIQGNNRSQAYFSTLEDQVAPDNPVRLLDAFIDNPDLSQLGFTSTLHKPEGRPPFAPQVLLKLYLYGYLNKIRSSSIAGFHKKACVRFLPPQSRRTCPLDPSDNQ